MAITKTNDGQFSNGGATSPVTSAIGFTPTSGRLLVVQMTGPSTSNAVTALATTNVTYSSPLLTHTSGLRRGRVFHGTVSASPGTNIQMTQAGGGLGFWDVSVGEFDGISGGYVAAASGFNNGTGTSVSTPTVTPPAGYETLLVAMLRGNGTAPSTPAGWTAFATTPNSSQVMLYRVIALSDGTTSYSASGTFGTSNDWYADILCFQSGQLTASITSPLSSGSGQPISLTITALRDGVVDPTFTGTATISKVSGTGTLAGTLTTAAFASGTATITTPTATPGGTNGGNWVLRATLTNGVTVDTANIMVRNDPFALASAGGGYGVTIPLIDSVESKLNHCECMFPGHMTVGVPIGVMFVTNPSSYYNSNAPGGVQDGPSRFRAHDPLLAYVDANKGTYPWISVSFPIEDAADIHSKASWVHALGDLLDLLELDGITIDRDQIKGHGWSTGLITLLNAVGRRPDFFSSVSPNDAAYVSDEPTHSGAGPDFYGWADGSLYDGPGYADTALFPVVAQMMKNSRTAIYWNGGTDQLGPGTGSWGVTPYARDIWDNRPFFTALQAIEPAAVMLSGSSTTSQMPGTYPRFVYERWDGTSNPHGTMESRVVNSTNIASFLAWHQAQTRLPERAPASRRMRARRLIAAEAA